VRGNCSGSSSIQVLAGFAGIKFREFNKFAQIKCMQKFHVLQYVLRVLVVTTVTSIYSEIQEGLTLWYWLTQIVLETAVKTSVIVLLYNTYQNRSEFASFLQFFPSLDK